MDTKLARAWLSDNGYRVKPKGRIPQDLLAIYQAKVLKKSGVRANVSGVVNGVPAPVLQEPGSQEEVPESVLRSKKKVKRSSCGFCTVNAAHQHKHCPGTINQGKMGIWVCLCYEKDHTLNVHHL